MAIRSGRDDGPLAATGVDLACIGLATLDTIVALPRWPEPDGRVVAEAMTRAGGGPAATAGVAAARLGRTVTFIGTVGADESADKVRRGLAEAGVDVAHLGTRPGRTSESVILVNRESATRAVLHAPGVEAQRLTPAALAACRSAEWIHVDHAGWPLATTLPRSRLSVDAGNPVPTLELRGLGLYAPTVDALASRYPGASVKTAVRRALAEGAERVVVTMGAAGALAADRGDAWRVPAADVEVVSTLGAGDVFHGALVAGLLDGLPLPEALRLANVAAALSCRALDGRSAIPSRAELEMMLAGTPAAERIELDGNG